MVAALLGLAACGSDSTEPQPADIPFTVTRDEEVIHGPGPTTRAVEITLEAPGYIQWRSTVGTVDDDGTLPAAVSLVAWHLPDGATGSLSACATTLGLSDSCTWRIVSSQ